jgi:hypothetical protein
MYTYICGLIASMDQQFEKYEEIAVGNISNREICIHVCINMCIYIHECINMCIYTYLY